MAKLVPLGLFFLIVFIVVADEAGESEMGEEGELTVDNYYRLRADLDSSSVIRLSKLRDL